LVVVKKKVVVVHTKFLVSQDVNGNVDRVEFGCGLERLFH
jgi:hypothetical protein